MQPDDVRAIIRFNTRMGMFICPIERCTVVSFLNGYQYGARMKDHCFTKELSKHILAKHGIKGMATGWPYQVEQLAKRIGLEWMDAYLIASSEVLSAALEKGASPRQTKRSSGPRQ